MSMFSQANYKSVFYHTAHISFLIQLITLAVHIFIHTVDEDVQNSTQNKHVCPNGMSHMVVALGHNGSIYFVFMTNTGAMNVSLMGFLRSSL